MPYLTSNLHQSPQPFKTPLMIRDSPPSHLSSLPWTPSTTPWKTENPSRPYDWNTVSWVLSSSWECLRDRSTEGEIEKIYRRRFYLKGNRRCWNRFTTSRNDLGQRDGLRRNLQLSLNLHFSGLTWGRMSCRSSLIGNESDIKWKNRFHIPSPIPLDNPCVVQVNHQFLEWVIVLELF